MATEVGIGSLLERPLNRVVPHGTVDEQERAEDSVADAERYEPTARSIEQSR
jgi:hypothetical protein